MKQAWCVSIEGKAKEVDPEHVLEQLLEHHAVITHGRGLLGVTFTVEAHSPIQAVEIAQEILSTALNSKPLDVDRIEAITEERQERELEQSNLPDLVGLAEIAEMANTTRQRVFQMTANKGFPAALLELRSGRLWLRPAIQSYLEGRQAGRGHRVKSLTSQVGGPTVAAALRSKGRALARRK